jgi:hypothetical protein
VPTQQHSTGSNRCCATCGRAGLKSRGTFYRGGRAFLHFHEHGTEFYADGRLRDDFERFPATTAKDREALPARVDAALGAH